MLLSLWTFSQRASGVQNVKHSIYEEFICILFWKKYEFSCLVTYFNYKIDTKRTRRNTRREKISMINFYGFVNKSIFTNHFNILFSLRRNIWISQVPKLCLISFLKDIRIPLLFSWEKIYNLFILSLPYLFLVSRLLKCR